MTPTSNEMKKKKEATVLLLMLMPNTISSEAQIYINSSTVLSATDFLFLHFLVLWLLYACNAFAALSLFKKMAMVKVFNMLLSASL